MKKLKQNFLMIFLTLSSLTTIEAQTSPSPGIEWSNVSWMDEDVNDNPLTQNDSGEEWWYEHKNVYVSGVHTGYVTVGYSSLVSKGTSATSLNKYSDVVNYYNEGATTSYYNPIIASDYNYGSITPNGDCLDRDYVGEHRTPVRGTVALNDLKGNMTWCKSLTNGEMQGVIQIGNYIYVVGSHFGTTPLNNHLTFLTYNPTTANPNNNFSPASIGLPLSSISSNDVARHIYVAKLDLSGTILWEHIYGEVDYGTNAVLALKSESYAYDVIMSSNNNLIIAGNITDNTLATPEGKSFVLEVEPNNGLLINKNTLPNSTILLNGSSGIACTGAGGKAICEIGSTQTYAFAAQLGFYLPDSNPNLTIYEYEAAVYKLNSSLVPMQNPTRFFGQKSNVWDIIYHTGLNKILLPLTDVCIKCDFAGINSGIGNIYKLDPNTFSVVGPASSLGPITAFDLRVGVCETSDGGFAAVSSFSPTTGYPLPTNAELGGLTSCTGFNNAPLQVFDTDALVCKFNASGVLQWKKVFDVQVNYAIGTIRNRQPFPGDIKRQECLYKISQAQDGGFVISGNTSFNFDDNYLVKIYSECNQNQPYDIVGPLSYNTTVNWNSNHMVKGIITVASGGILNITGAATTIQFADSKASGIPTKIIVKPGGRLIINGATLTSVLACPNTIWSGIEVEGTYNQPQNQLLGYQGYLRILNGGTISNARLAILTGLSINDYFVDGTKTGGIVIASNANFINNMGDVAFFSYHNPNLITNISGFTACNFKINAALLNGETPQYRALVADVDALKFIGCNFENTTGAIGKGGYGIYSIDATMFVDQLNASTPTKISGFDNGVYISNSNPLRVPSIKNTSFLDNYYNSTYINNVTTPIFENNYIRTSSVGGVGTGLYLNNCKNYTVRNTTFLQNTNLFDGGDIGMYINNSQTGAHNVYRNSFANFSAGIVADGNNSGVTNTTDGLKMNCNDFTAIANAYDIALVGTTAPTVMKTQGAVSTDPTTLVRNRYAATSGCSGCENQWYIQSASAKVGGYTHGANSNANTRPTPQPQLSDIAVNVINSNITFQPQHCPISNIPANPGCLCNGCCRLADINNALTTAVAQSNSIVAGYNSKLDNGNTQTLLNAINGNTSNGNLKNMLAAAPFLSDTVLKAYFSKNGTPNGHIKDIHALNAPVTAPVWQLLVNLNLPNGINNQITGNQNATKVSNRTNAEALVNLANFEVQDIAGQKLNYFLTDSLDSSKDSVIQVLTTNVGKLPNANLLLIYANLNKGNITAANNAIADLRSKQPDLANYLAIVAHLQTAANKLFSLLDNQQDVNFLIDYASKSENTDYSGARAILEYVMGSKFAIPRLLPLQNNARLLSNQPETITPFTEAEVNNIKIYPNPTDGILTIELPITSNSEAYRDVLIEVTNSLGQVVYTTKILTQTATLNLQSLTGGIYILSAYNGKAKLYQAKIVKVN